MNCDEAIEFLPWLLNGTLEAGERDEVRRHLATCGSCRVALKDTRDVWTIFGQHLPGDALVALAYGETPPGVDPAVAERHLASCPECAAELELVRTSRRLEEDDKIAVFPDVGARQEKSADQDRRWRAAAMAAGFTGLVALSGWFYEFQQAGDLAERLAQRPASVQEARPVAPVPPPPRPIDDAARQRLADLSGQLQEFQKTQAELDRQLNQAKSQIAELEKQPRGALEPQIISRSIPVSEARDVVRGEAKVIVVPRDQAATVDLGTDAEDDAPRSIEILDSGNQRKWSASGLSRNVAAGEYRFFLPAGFLKPGSYTLQLYSNVNGTRVPRESYKIRVE